MEDKKIIEWVQANQPKDMLMTAAQDVELRAVMNLLEIDTVVEIGTYHGESAAFMAQFANRVITFDITDYPEKWPLWEAFNFIEKIEFTQVKTKEEIVQALALVEFDFAFVDDGHSYEECAADFEIVKHCGRVLFHDVNHPNFKGVLKFAEEIGCKIFGNYGYWTK